MQKVKSPPVNLDEYLEGDKDDCNAHGCGM